MNTKHYRRIGVCLRSVVCLVPALVCISMAPWPAAMAEDQTNEQVTEQTEQAPEQIQAPTAKQLKQAAYNSQWRLQRAIERDGFYSARVALNIWRSNAMDAGLFDQGKYDEFKKQIYEKSVQSNLTCFETFLEINDFIDARICLYTWKSHAQELGVFDQALFDEMTARMEEQERIQAENEQNTTQTDTEAN